MYVRPGYVTIGHEESIPNNNVLLPLGPRLTKVTLTGLNSITPEYTAWETSHGEWEFLSSLPETNVVIKDERILGVDIATNLVCPKSITYVCQKEFKGDSGIEGLVIALGSWAGERKC